MLMRVSDAHKNFNQMFPDKSVSISFFFRNRPRNILSIMKTRHNVCCCEKCENMNLFFNAIRTFQLEPREFKSINDLMLKLICDREKFECMSSRCENCKYFLDIAKNFFKPDCFQLKINFSSVDQK